MGPSGHLLGSIGILMCPSKHVMGLLLGHSGILMGAIGVRIGTSGHLLGPSVLLTGLSGRY